MKKRLFATLLLSGICVGAFCADTPEAKTEQPAAPKVELKAPFNMMTPAEQTSTGINKLSGPEQEALGQWWAKQKNHPQLQIAKEVTLTAVQDDGKYIVLSDGTRLTLAKSYRKKVAKWIVGDKIGIGEAGRRGAVTLYHMPTGHKIKAKRDQAPEKKSEKHK
jgi:hypothetical protein